MPLTTAVSAVPSISGHTCSQFPNPPINTSIKRRKLF